MCWSQCSQLWRRYRRGSTPQHSQKHNICGLVFDRCKLSSSKHRSLLINELVPQRLVSDLGVLIGEDGWPCEIGFADHAHVSRVRFRQYTALVSCRARNKFKILLLNRTSVRHIIYTRVVCASWCPLGSSIASHGCTKRSTVPSLPCINMRTPRTAMHRSLHFESVLLWTFVLFQLTRHK